MTINKKPKELCGFNKSKQLFIFGIVSDTYYRERSVFN